MGKVRVFGWLGVLIIVLALIWLPTGFDDIFTTVPIMAFLIASVGFVFAMIIYAGISLLIILLIIVLGLKVRFL